MAVTSVVKLSELEGLKRIDAEYYQLAFSSYENNIKNIGYDLLKRYSEKVFSGPFGSTLRSESYQESGIPFIRISNIVDIFIPTEDLVYISEKEHKRIFSTHLNPGDIVFSKIGTIGRLSVISEDLGQVNISENNIGIRLRQLPIYERIFILFFLLSQYGQIQIIRRASGNVQPKLNVKDIESVKIPKVGDETKIELAEKYEQIYALYNQSLSLYSRAENLLLEELGLRDFKPKYELSYTVILFEVFKARRVDAEYFQPKYEALLKKIEEFEFTKLHQLAERVAAKVKPNPEETYKYIEISDIAIDIGETNYTDRLGKELPPNARIPINGGELIISKVRPTRGAISIIPKELGGSVICSSAFSVFKAESPLKEYLYIVSRSIIGKSQLERPTTGTSYPTIGDRDIENMQIPLLPPETQKKIASLVQQSHEARRKAKELLEEAKTKVEQMIETASLN